MRSTNRGTRRPARRALARIIGYIPTWKTNEAGEADLKLYANPELYRNITHGIAAFLTFDKDLSGAFSKANRDQVGRVIDVIAKTAGQEGVRISIAIGGADDLPFFEFLTRVGKEMGAPGNESAAPLDRVVADLLAFVDEHKLDGVDLDLEGWWGKSAQEDQGGRPLGQAHPAGLALTALAKKIRQAHPRLLISAAGFGTSWYGNNYDWKLVESLDWIGLMTYDLTGSWSDSPVGPHSALRVIRNQGAYQAEQQGAWPVGPEYNPKVHGLRPDYNPIHSAEDSLWYWTNPLYSNFQGRGQSIPRDKVALGVPAYGYDFAAAEPVRNKSYRTIPYKDIVEKFPGEERGSGNIKRGGETKRPSFVKQPGPYSYEHNIYFETPEAAVAKLEFPRRVGCQGVIVWDVTQDVLGDDRSILRALARSAGPPPGFLATNLLAANVSNNESLAWEDWKVVVAWTAPDGIHVKAGDSKTVILDEQTVYDSPPVLLSAYGRLLLAWTGTDGAFNLRWSEDGVLWGEKLKIPQGIGLEPWADGQSAN